jgi:tripartite-type tricarboxylate transporter receptor subunit TctC
MTSKRNALPNPRRRILSIAALALAAHAPWAVAQSPDFSASGKPITFVVPFPPGGPLDAVARILGEAVRPSLGNVVVENRSGAGGNIGMDVVAKAAPDGHTIGMGALSTHAINPWLYPRMPFDPLKDFQPVTLVADLPNVLVLNADFAAQNNIRNVGDLIAYLKRNPGKANFASGGNGSGGHLAAELFKQVAGVYMVHIPYRGAAPAQTALLSGDVQLMFDNLGSAAARIREGRIKAIGVTTLRRASAYPDLPTVAESGVSGFKDFDISTWFGIFAPAGTPPAIVDKLNKEFTAALRSPAVRERMLKLAAEPAPTTPTQFGDLVRRENRRYESVVKRSGAKVD